MSILYLLPLIVLVPMIPAYVLFKVLKSTGEVQSPSAPAGPLAGLKVQLSGAFAGYFPLLLVLLYYFRPYLIPPPIYEVWTFRGTIVDKQQQQRVDVPSTNFELFPASFPPVAAQNGQFQVSFIPQPQEGGGVMFPAITINDKDYIKETVDLATGKSSGGATDPIGLTWDKTHHVVSVSQIALVKADANNRDVHTSPAVPTDGVPEQYQQIGSVTPIAPPPGYAR